MNKSGQTGGTAGATAAAMHRQRALLQRADTDISSLMDNFSHLLKAARMNEPVRNAQENFQMDVHASRVVQAADSLLKLVSELKQNAVFSDFKSLNKQVEENIAKHEELNNDTDKLGWNIGEQLKASLREAESQSQRSMDQLIS